MDPAPILPPHTRRQIAVAAYVDPRTVERWMHGRPMKSTVAARITQAVKDLGLDIKPAAKDAA